MATSSIRVLIVDDLEPFRRTLRSILQDALEWQTIVEASDGVEAIDLTQALQPELILLDIGLPKLDGIEAARRIRKLAPQSKVIFVSQESSVDVVHAALGTGALGFVVKMDVGRELFPAMKAVLRGETFVGSRFAGHDFTQPSDLGAAGTTQSDKVLRELVSLEIACRHEAGFYADDASLLDGFTQFIGAALKGGNSVIVIATESHRDSLLPRLQAHGLDIAAAIEQGRYISLDAVETLSTFMVSGMPDPVRFFELAGNLILNAAKAAKGKNRRVAACGEGTALLWAQGNAEAALRLEHLWNEIVKSYDVDVFCAYSLGSVQSAMDGKIFDELCAVHSADHLR